MLTGIGIIIILKQIPHLFGYDADPEGDFAFFQLDGENTFSEIFKSINFISLGSTIVGALGLGILILWDKVLSKKGKIFNLIQGPLVAVVAGIVYYLATQSSESLGIDS
jgi:MFS superfamily sulfate permease-like transporter